MQLKSRQELINFWKKVKSLSIIRAQEAQSLTEAVTALREGGIKLHRGSMTTPEH